MLRKPFSLFVFSLIAFVACLTGLAACPPPLSDVLDANVTDTGTQLLDAEEAPILDASLVSHRFGSIPPPTGTGFMTVTSDKQNATALAYPLPHANGGTDVISVGASGNVLTSNGTSWTSASPIIAAQTPAALNVDWSTSSSFKKTLATGAQAFTFSNQADGQTIVFAITAVGGTTVSWPAGVKWSNGTPPTQTAPGVDVYTFTDIGGTLYGSSLKAMN